MQLAGRDIDDKATLQAMHTVPRHLFVPEDQQQFAYNDRPLPIGRQQTISQPYMVAYMTQAIQPKPSDRVLEVGTGSGYQAAVLAEIVDTVYTIEIIPELGQSAEKLLRDLRYNNIHVKIGDGYHGWHSHAPFDAIIVTAGATEIPEHLIRQLREGGRMIIPVGPHGGIRKLILIRKRKGKISTTNLMQVRFVPFTRN